MQQDEQFEQLDGQNGNDAEEAVEENKMDSQAGGDDDDNDDEKKVFVGGLSWDTTTKALREYFEKYGEVTNCTLKTDFESKRSRGFGFVSFSSTDAVDAILAEKEHKLHGRNIDPKRANPRPVNKKVFVGKVDPATSQEDIKAYFETFGPVDKVELPYDKQKEQRRAFVFVEFAKLSAMKKCLEQADHKIGTQEVDVKKATLPGAAAGGGAVRGGPRGRGYGPPRGRGGYGNYGGYDQGYGGYGGGYGYGGYDQGYGGYGGYGGNFYGSGGGNGGYNYGGWNNGGGYDQSYGYGYGNQSNYGKAQKRGAGHGGYHPYNR